MCPSQGRGFLRLRKGIKHHEELTRFQLNHIGVAATFTLENWCDGSPFLSFILAKHNCYWTRAAERADQQSVLHQS